MHMLEHYVADIRFIGTTDNTNTELTERMHIESAKHALKASNRRDYIVQMCRWLQRRQAIYTFAVYLAWREGKKHDARKRPPKSLELKRKPVVLPASWGVRIPGDPLPRCRTFPRPVLRSATVQVLVSHHYTHRRRTLFIPRQSTPVIAHAPPH